MSPKEAVTLFSRQYRECTGEPYIPSWGRDAKIFKDILGVIPAERIEGLIIQFFSKERKSYSIPWFRAIVNDLTREESSIVKVKKMENPDSGRFL